MKKIHVAQQSHCQLKSSKADTLYASHYSLYEQKAFYLLSGLLEVCCDQQKIVLLPGEVGLFAPEEIHQLFNPGPERAE